MRTIMVLFILAMCFGSCGPMNSHEYITAAPGGEGIWLRLREQGETKVPVTVSFEVKKGEEWELRNKKELTNDLVLTNVFISAFFKTPEKGDTLRIQIFEQDKVVRSSRFVWQ